MTDLIEIRARRSSAACLHLTILAAYLDPSEVDRLRVVLAGTDNLTRRIGLDLRLRGYGVGLLVNAAACGQIEGAPDAVHGFLRDYVEATYADPEGDEDIEDFDPDGFDIPDDGEPPTSAFAIDRFIRAGPGTCTIGAIHDPGAAHTRAALAAQGPRWSSVADVDRPHFSLELSLVADALAQLFDGASWSTAYSL